MSKIRFVYSIQKSPSRFYLGSATLNSLPKDFYGQSSSDEFLPEIVKSNNYIITILQYCSDAKCLKQTLKSFIDTYTKQGFDLTTSTQEHKDKISKSLKNKWNDTTYVKKQEELRSDISYREKLSLARKTMYENLGTDICVAMSNLVNSRWSDESKRINQSIKLKEKWQDSDFRDKVMQNRKKPL
jgi:hypothetical protein